MDGGGLSSTLLSEFLTLSSSFAYDTRENNGSILNIVGKQ